MEWTRGNARMRCHRLHTALRRPPWFDRKRALDHPLRDASFVRYYHLSINLELATGTNLYLSWRYYDVMTSQCESRFQGRLRHESLSVFSSVHNHTGAIISFNKHPSFTRKLVYKSRCRCPQHTHVLWHVFTSHAAPLIAWGMLLPQQLTIQNMSTECGGSMQSPWLMLIWSDLPAAKLRTDCAVARIKPVRFWIYTSL